MKLAEQIAEQALPDLGDWLNRLLGLTDEMVSGVKYSEEDHLSFMALCFLHKQVDHARSLTTRIWRAIFKEKRKELSQKWWCHRVEG